MTPERMADVLDEIGTGWWDKGRGFSLSHECWAALVAYLRGDPEPLELLHDQAPRWRDNGSVTNQL